MKLLETVGFLLFGVTLGVVIIATVGILLDLFIEVYTDHSVIREFIRPLFN